MSLLAVLNQPIVGRDAALYLSISFDPSITDVSSALKRFNWPWYPLCIKFISGLSGLSPEIVARLSCEFMTAIACLLAADIVRRNRPDLAAWAALLVLAVPAFNEYRGEILRENGFWCFSLLALWLMYVMKHARLVSRASLVCLSTILAAAFRFEAVYLFIVLAVVEFSRMHGKLLKISVITGGLVLAATILFSLSHRGLLPAGRISAFVNYLDPVKIYGDFSVFTRYAALEMPKYSYKDTKLIFFIGLCGYLIVKIVSALGVFSLPWALSLRLPEKARALAWDPMTVAAIGYGGILLAFLIGKLFLTGRYAAFLGFLLLPGICAGTRCVARRWPRYSPFIVLLCVILAIANVVSLSEPKIFIRDAGAWIADNLPKDARIYFEDGRIGYYARRYHTRGNASREAALPTEEGNEAYGYFVLRCQPDSALRQLQERGLHPIRDFRGGGCVTIFRKTEDQSAFSPLKLLSSR
ncbi:MAG: hypothetical protein LBD06_02985 [Candidatus Accumulibacter sp.]|nr:hypothetical protein [Accumulibacter sp.]